jgi:GNAT superfamily N-acetyltransferase
MVEVTRASIDRVPELASLIGRAFADDPNALWSLGPAATPEQVIQWFEAPDRIVAQEGLLWEAGHALGAALWFPPGTEDPYRDYDRESRRVIKVLADDGGTRGSSYWDWIEEHLPSKPHWFLDSIAVRADQRGKGFGRALIDIGLRGAKEEGVPAFLETARPENVPKYEHVGFRVVNDEDAPSSGPHVWFMQFDP